MKIEIEHLHHLLDQARLRLTRDFEHWYATVYLATAAAPSLFGSGEDLHMNRLRESTNSSISLLSTTTANTTTSTSTTTSAAAATLGRSDSGKHGFDYKGSSDSLSAPNNGASIASKASLAFSTLPIYSTNNSQRPPSRSSSSGQIMGVVSHDRTGSGRFYPSSTSSSSSPAPTLYSSASSSSPSRSNLSSLSSLAADLNHTASVSEKIRLAGLSSSSSSSLPSVNVKEEIDAFYKARSELLQKQHSK